MLRLAVVPELPWPNSRVLASNLLLRAELDRVAFAFERAGIAWLVLKGLPLAERVYGSIGQRFSVDNDLLVRLADVPRAIFVLEEAGYSSSPGRNPLDDLAATFQHPMRRTLPSGLVARLEVHWNAFPPHLYEVSEDVLWSHSETFFLGPTRLRVFDAELTLLHLASHFVQHRCAELRILSDVGRALTTWQSKLDRQALDALSRRTGTRAALVFAWQAARRLGLTAVHPWLEDKRAEFVLRLLPAERLSNTESPSYLQMAASLLLADAKRIPVALKHELFPHPSVLARIYETPVPKHPYALYLRRFTRPLSSLRSGSRVP